MNPFSRRPKRGEDAVDSRWGQLPPRSLGPLFLELLLKPFADASCPKLLAIGTDSCVVVVEEPFEVLSLRNTSLLGTGFAIDFHVEREPGGEAVAIVLRDEHCHGAPKQGQQ